MEFHAFFLATASEEMKMCLFGRTKDCFVLFFLFVSTEKLKNKKGSEKVVQMFVFCQIIKNLSHQLFTFFWSNNIFICFFLWFVFHCFSVFFFHFLCVYNNFSKMYSKSNSFSSFPSWCWSFKGEISIKFENFPAVFISLITPNPGGF